MTALEAWRMPPEDHARPRRGRGEHLRRARCDGNVTGRRRVHGDARPLGRDVSVGAANFAEAACYLSTGAPFSWVPSLKIHGRTIKKKQSLGKKEEEAGRKKPEGRSRKEEAGRKKPEGRSRKEEDGRREEDAPRQENFRRFTSQRVKLRGKDTDWIMRTATHVQARAIDDTEPLQRGSGRRIKAASAPREEELARAMTDALEHILEYEERSKW